MKSKQVDVCVDVGGSSTKISIKNQQSDEMTLPIKFNNNYLFQKKWQAGKKIAKAIISTLRHYGDLNKVIQVVAISQTGIVDNQSNVLVLSDRLQECESTGQPYGRFDMAAQIKQAFKKEYFFEPKVVLLNDSISACLDPSFEQKLVLTLTMGTYPVISLKETKNKQIKVYQSITSNWVDQIVLSKGQNITMTLRGEDMRKRDDLQNCDLIVEAADKILKKYFEVFKWQPQCFILLGGYANVLKHVKSWQKVANKVKIITITDHDRSVHTQMRGVLYYAYKGKTQIDII